MAVKLKFLQRLALRNRKCQPNNTPLGERSTLRVARNSMRLYHNLTSRPHKLKAVWLLFITLLVGFISGCSQLRVADLSSKAIQSGSFSDLTLPSKFVANTVPIPNPGRETSQTPTAPNNNVNLASVASVDRDTQTIALLSFDQDVDELTFEESVSESTDRINNLETPSSQLPTAIIPLHPQSDSPPTTNPSIAPTHKFSDSPKATPATGSHEVPFHPAQSDFEIVQSIDEQVSVSARETPLQDVLALIARQQSLSIVAPHDMDKKITINLQPTSLENALNAIMAVSGCVYTRINDVIYVTVVDKESTENFAVQGRMVWVFDLNYIASEDAEKVITGLLSPVGKVFSRAVDIKDKRRTVEQIVVEDLPPFIRRIEGYLMHADQPPRQVVVEARVLQIKLGRDDRHGINFEAIGNVDGTNIILGTQLLATGTSPGAVFTVTGSRFNNLVDCLVTTTDSKTLASPKLLMINGQESRIQIGRRIGFSTSTTTQTVTVENVQFLDVGVVLSVTPQITADGNILMRINPKVSTGEISPVNNLPQEETTELETTVMVADGDGVIIGGLIQESDVKRQSKLPFLGDLWLVGRLFQRNTVARERSEVVVALLPRIVNPQVYCLPEEYNQLQRADLPLLTPDIKSAKRPEPTLPDAIDNPVWPNRGRRAKR